MKDIRTCIDGLFEQDLRAKRVDSLAGATLGGMTGGSLAVAAIGPSLAQARGLVTKHAIKQAGRPPSNQGIDVWDSFAHWVPHLIGARKKIGVAMDWTDHGPHGQAKLVLNLVTAHGRATLLLWLTVRKEELTEQRNDFEYACRARLRALVPAGRAVTILADRGFGDHELFAFPDDVGFDYAIRFRGNIYVADATGEKRTAAGWVGKSGRAPKLRGARLAASLGYKAGAVVCVHAKAMREPWCLAVSDAGGPAAEAVNRYAKRWTIEPNFRDTKDLRFGMGLVPRASANRPEATARCRSTPSQWCCSLCLAPPAKASAGSAAEIQRLKEAHALVVPAGLHTVRTHSGNAGIPPAPAREALRRVGRAMRSVQRPFRGRLK